MIEIELYCEVEELVKMYENYIEENEELAKHNKNALRSEKENTRKLMEETHSLIMDNYNLKNNKDLKLVNLVVKVFDINKYNFNINVLYQEVYTINKINKLIEISHYRFSFDETLNLYMATCDLETFYFDKTLINKLTNFYPNLFKNIQG